jgi:pimeloyl-ACP methyl ester carboxylesterase
VTGPVLHFGDYHLDPGSGQLLHGATPVPLAPKVYALLQYLAGQPGRLVDKRELLEALWPDVFVGDAVLKTAVRDLRKALGDDPREPRFIETKHRRGYRFIAPVTADAPSPAATRTPPQVCYARSGSVNIAYQVVGSGPIDLVFVMGWVSHLDYFWNEPSFARFLDRLAARGRLILFDKRGTGLSDPVPVTELPTLEQRLDDVRAVMDAAGSERAVLLGVSEGGPLCSLFAATYPHKTEALVMIGSYARRLRDIDYPWGQTRDEHARFCQAILDGWGGPVGIEERAPSRMGDPTFREWWSHYLRLGGSPGAAVALTRMNAEIDIRDVLPSIRVPTLVLHRTGDRCLKVEEGRYLASRIPGAAFVELAGDDHLPFVGDQAAMLDAIESFLAGRRSPDTSERVLATVLAVTVPIDSSSRDDVRRLFERQVSRARGRMLSDSAGLAAAFDGPGRAVQCGEAVMAAALRAGAEARAGVHIGECDLAHGRGPVVETSTAIAALAIPGEVLVSRTVVDLIHGSGLRFKDRDGLAASGLSVLSLDN